jgi:hypothetical protein
VVCRIFQKFGSGPQNGVQYGAPYMEEEWEEEDDDAVEKEAAVGASAKVAAATSDAADGEFIEEEENGYCKTSELAQVSTAVFHKVFANVAQHIDVDFCYCLLYTGS